MWILQNSSSSFFLYQRINTTWTDTHVKLWAKSPQCVWQYKVTDITEGWELIVAFVWDERLWVCFLYNTHKSVNNMCTSVVPKPSPGGTVQHSLLFPVLKDVQHCNKQMSWIRRIWGEKSPKRAGPQGRDMGAPCIRAYCCFSSFI